MPITTYKDEKRLEKLKEKNYEESLKLIYEWVKKSVIDFKTFRKYVEEATNNERREFEADEWE